MKRFAKLILALEPILLAVVVGAFWFEYPTRVNFLPLLLLPMLARLILYRRLWVNTPLNALLYLFLLLCIANTYIALSDPANPPYSWGWYQIGRPVMGVALALSLMSIAYERGSANGLVLVTLLVALVVGVLGVGSAQFIDKSDQLESIIRLMPRITGFPGAEGGFNVNEIGGAMAFFAPFAAGILIYEGRQRTAPLRAALALLALALLALALMLGQSRTAIIGVLVALGGVILLLTRRGWGRYLALGILAIFCVLEILIARQLLQPASASAGNLLRDESSQAQRVEIWTGAITLIRENPLTGYGLNTFRRREVRERFVPNYEMNIIPHAHNEVLQIGADLGIPGIFVYIAWHLALAYMLWRAWKIGTFAVKGLAVSAAAGLLAHAIFGMADAITLFDRFTFAYWLLVGLAGSAYVLTRLPAYRANPEALPSG
jgi:O-antigen ligase